MRVYERVEPSGRCISPDGHDYVESYTYASPIPDECICPTCGKPWQIVTFEADDAQT